MGATFRSTVLWLSLGIGLSSLLVLSSYSLAQEWDDYNDDGEYASSPYQPPSQQSYSTLNPATSAVDPPPQPIQEPPKQRRSLLQRLFTPLVKNPPIMQPKKTPKEEGRETLALADPLLRLTTDVSYQGKVVPAGYYLIRFSTLPSSKRAFLTLMRRNEAALSIFAMKVDSTETAHAQPAQPKEAYMATGEDKQALEAELDVTPKTVPQPDPDKKKEAKKDPQELGPFVFTELSEDGQFLMLVYQHDKHQYISAPLTIAPGATNQWEQADQDDAFVTPRTP